ncbi:hypothetical protein LTR91_000953 [Friedmanniomyces endolithicus]|uniref:EF-hand domain-containing protein n=1 Tax=Friedmanniomyces endolithicus TaxID=329885 RepID=A0AAN6L149_9PEZI|nr:hypothetical protein LTR57_021189 [Friedmanniomyces endolithicus]KAK0964842.1 hypothetical protein LTS01_018631 [Friedmanniomyces endolithicus]KAK1015151.1 hypothetical protein LTR91_000953 [Friedmanniomyces endolithicus]KAK1037781.1 hypothetical protein LTS16_012550 [Friedmanniomyces endolithicus]
MIGHFFRSLWSAARALVEYLDAETLSACDEEFSAPGGWSLGMTRIAEQTPPADEEPAGDDLSPPPTTNGAQVDTPLPPTITPPPPETAPLAKPPRATTPSLPSPPPPTPAPAPPLRLLTICLDSAETPASRVPRNAIAFAAVYRKQATAYSRGVRCVAPAGSTGRCIIAALRSATASRGISRRQRMMGAAVASPTMFAARVVKDRGGLPARPRALGEQRPLEAIVEDLFAPFANLRSERCALPLDRCCGGEMVVGLGMGGTGVDAALPIEQGRPVYQPPKPSQPAEATASPVLTPSTTTAGPEIASKTGLDEVVPSFEVEHLEPGNIMAEAREQEGGAESAAGSGGSDPVPVVPSPVAQEEATPPAREATPPPAAVVTPVCVPFEHVAGESAMVVDSAPVGSQELVESVSTGGEAGEGGDGGEMEMTWVSGDPSALLSDDHAPRVGGDDGEDGSRARDGDKEIGSQVVEGEGDGSRAHDGDEEIGGQVGGGGEDGSRAHDGDEEIGSQVAWEEAEMEEPTGMEVEESGQDAEMEEDDGEMSDEEKAMIATLEADWSEEEEGEAMPDADAGAAGAFNGDPAPVSAEGVAEPARDQDVGDGILHYDEFMDFFDDADLYSEPATQDNAAPAAFVSTPEDEARKIVQSEPVGAEGEEEDLYSSSPRPKHALPAVESSPSTTTAAPPPPAAALPGWSLPGLFVPSPGRADSVLPRNEPTEAVAANTTAPSPVPAAETTPAAPSRLFLWRPQPFRCSPSEKSRLYPTKTFKPLEDPALKIGLIRSTMLTWSRCNATFLEQMVEKHKSMEYEHDFENVVDWDAVAIEAGFAAERCRQLTHFAENHRVDPGIGSRCYNFSLTMDGCAGVLSNLRHIDFWSDLDGAVSDWGDTASVWGRDD